MRGAKKEIKKERELKVDEVDLKVDEAKSKSGDPYAVMNRRNELTLNAIAKAKKSLDKGNLSDYKLVKPELQILLGQAEQQFRQGKEIAAQDTFKAL